MSGLSLYTSLRLSPGLDRFSLPDVAGGELGDGLGECRVGLGDAVHALARHAEHLRDLGEADEVIHVQQSTG